MKDLKDLEDELKKATRETDEAINKDFETKPSKDDFSEGTDLDGEEIPFPNADLDVPEYEDEEDDEGDEVQTKEIPINPGERSKKSAVRYIRSFQSILKGFLPGVYRKKILKSGDSERIKEWRKKKELNPNTSIEDAVTSDDELYHTLKRYERLEKAIDDIEFTKDEINDLSEPLSEVIEKYKHLQMSPEMSLVISVLIVMLPRIEPIFPNFGTFVEKITNG